MIYFIKNEGSDFMSRLARGIEMFQYLLVLELDHRSLKSNIVYMQVDVHIYIFVLCV